MYSDIRKTKTITGGHAAQSLKGGVPMYIRRRNENQRPASIICKGGPYSVGVPLRQRPVPRGIDQINGGREVEER